MTTEYDWTRVFSLYMNASLLSAPVSGGWQTLLEKEPLAITERCVEALEGLTASVARGDDPSAVWARAADLATAAGIVASAYERAAKNPKQ